MPVLFGAAMEAGWAAWAVLGLLALQVGLFAWERIRVDVAALLGMVLLLLLRIVNPEEAFAGFGSPTIIMLASVFIIGAALQETGFLEMVGTRWVGWLPPGEGWMVFGVMALAAVLSAFMNNTSVTAMLVPLLGGLARRNQVSPSRLLMPAAFGAILGGTCTLIGTSTNVAVSGFVSTRAGLPPFGLFEMTAVGVILVGVGIAYMVLVGRRFLPRHPEEDLADDFGMRGFLSEIVLLPGSPMVGRSVAESDLARMEFRILKIVRGGRGFAPEPDSLLQERDVLLVTGNVANLMKVKATEGIEIRPELKLGDADLKRAGLELAEVVVSPRSTLIERTLKEARFQQEFGLTVLALYRAGQSLRERISRIRLRAGDLLLVQGRREAMDRVRRRRELAVLAERGPASPSQRRAATAGWIFAAALVAGGFDVVPLATSFLIAAVAMVLSGCLRPVRLYDHIDWRLLVLIGVMLAFGRAMENSKAADLLAQWVISLCGGLGPMAVLAGFCLVTILLTQPMSNAAAALVVLPGAIEAAERLGVDARSYALAIMLSASISVAAPLEPACVLVYGPGKYRFMDFVKVGFPLTLLLLAVLFGVLPWWWPL